VHELADGHKLVVVLLDYWSVWLGGQYAAAQGDAYVDAAAAVTDDVNTAIRSTAAKTGSAYVDLRAAFKGPDYAYDETRYLSSDGDHPNAAGHQQIADATEAVIETALGL
jgi:lysophospholipase L1-like esterase